MDERQRRNALVEALQADNPADLMALLHQHPSIVERVPETKKKPLIATVLHYDAPACFQALEASCKEAFAAADLPFRPYKQSPSQTAVRMALGARAWRTLHYMFTHPRNYYAGFIETPEGADILCRAAWTAPLSLVDQLISEGALDNSTFHRSVSDADVFEKIYFEESDDDGRRMLRDRFNELRERGFVPLERQSIALAALRKSDHALFELTESVSASPREKFELFVPDPTILQEQRDRLWSLFQDIAGSSPWLYQARATARLLAATPVEQWARRLGDAPVTVELARELLAQYSSTAESAQVTAAFHFVAERSRISMFEVAVRALWTETYDAPAIPNRRIQELAFARLVEEEKDEARRLLVRSVPRSAEAAVCLVDVFGVDYNTVDDSEGVCWYAKAIDKAKAPVEMAIALVARGADVTAASTADTSLWMYLACRRNFDALAELLMVPEFAFAAAHDDEFKVTLAGERERHGSHSATGKRISACLAAMSRAKATEAAAGHVAVRPRSRRQTL